MKNKRLIQRIDKKYVGEDCIQKMVGYKNYLAIFGNGENLYCDFPNWKFIHRYIEDERKNEFPYSNIPMHNERALFQKYKVANQLLNFNIPYFIFSSEFLSISYAIRDGENALFVNDFLHSRQIEKYLIREELYVTREELDAFFTSSKEEIKYFYDKRWCNHLIIPTQEEIMYRFKKHIIEECIESQNMDNYYKNVLSFMVKEASSKYITDDFQFCIDDILMVKSKGKELSVSFVSIRFVSENCYKIIKRVVPIKLNTLEQIKGMNKKIVNANEPKISLSLNPNLTKEDIVEGAKLERILK